MLASLSSDIRQYLLITGNYWTFTLTDGALRMLVVLHFHTLGYTPLEIAFLFIFYEFFGVVTNLIGGWLGARIGLNRTMNIGLAMQVVALGMLAVPSSWLSIPWVMMAQAISGVAKDLNKMSAKSAIKLLVPSDAQGRLYHWVAVLTGSKNALKGVGFFLGGVLLTLFGFRASVVLMAALLCSVLIISLVKLKGSLGRSQFKPKFTDVFSKSRAVNVLSGARLFLFGARDVWFVIAVPVFFGEVLLWDHWSVGSFMAMWVIGYGVIQSFAPRITGKHKGSVPSGKAALWWCLPLMVIPAIMAYFLGGTSNPELLMVTGLLIFGAFFAINSSLHSYLIVSYARDEGASMDVGFYYMANAMGRLLGTVLSGWVYQDFGMAACLYVSSLFLGITLLLSIFLPQREFAKSNI